MVVVPAVQDVVGHPRAGKQMAGCRKRSSRKGKAKACLAESGKESIVYGPWSPEKVPVQSQRGDATCGNSYWRERTRVTDHCAAQASAREMGLVCAYSPEGGAWGLWLYWLLGCS